MIAIETKTMRTTASLPERKTEERERLTLSTIEDQADVQKLYYQLVATLADVSTWGGQTFSHRPQSTQLEFLRTP